MTSHNYQDFQDSLPDAEYQEWADAAYGTPTEEEINAMAQEWEERMSDHDEPFTDDELAEMLAEWRALQDLEASQSHSLRAA